MNEETAANELLQDLKGEISLEVYAIFEKDDTKHLLAETIIGTVIAGLVLEYLKGFLNPKETAHERSKALGIFFSGIRTGGTGDPELLKAQINQGLRDLRRAGTQSIKEEAVASFAQDLANAGLDVTSAEIIAGAVSKAVTAPRKHS